MAGDFFETLDSCMHGLCGSVVPSVLNLSEPLVHDVLLLRSHAAGLMVDMVFPVVATATSSAPYVP